MNNKLSSMADHFKLNSSTVMHQKKYISVFISNQETNIFEATQVGFATRQYDSIDFPHVYAQEQAYELHWNISMVHISIHLQFFSGNGCQYQNCVPSWVFTGNEHHQLKYLASWVITGNEHHQQKYLSSQHFLAVSTAFH